MKKILVVFDGEHFAASALDFVLELNHTEPVLLTGVFMPSVDYAEMLSRYYYGAIMAPVLLQEYDEDPAAIRKNIGMFEEFCQTHHIRYVVHKGGTQRLVQELKGESRYADLMVLSSALFYENLGESTQSEYLHDTMHKSECPVLLLPEKYRRPTNVVLAYDGSASAMHAIRQFVYLLPGFTDLETLVVYANKEGEELPFRDLVREYAPQHFSKLGYVTFDLDPRKYFNAWIGNKGVPLLVSGSYGRSVLSELFHRNFLSEVIRDHRVPVFVAHR